MKKNIFCEVLLREPAQISFKIRKTFKRNVKAIAEGLEINAK